MKAFGLSEKLIKGLEFKRDHIHGKLKKLGYMNWWEEMSDINKKRARQDAKKQIRKDLD